MNRCVSEGCIADATYGSMQCGGCVAVLGPVKEPKRPNPKTNQIVSTPREFLGAVDDRFGEICLDLAANEENRACDAFFGPGSQRAEDSFSVPWNNAADRGDLMWLNPPFAEVTRWAERCAAERKKGAKIALLVPASVCANWYIKHVIPHAFRFLLTPRVFKKEVRDCVLALYTPEGYTGSDVWNWKAMP